jgi:hypothetical protein
MRVAWRLFIGVLACGATAFAQAPTGAEKAAAASSTEVVFGPFAGAAFNSSSIIVTPFQDVLVTQIKPPGGKDLFINVSMETGIVAIPSLLNQAGFAQTSAQSLSQLEVRVLIDCPQCAQPYTDRPAEPGTINFDDVARVFRHVSTAGFDTQSDLVQQLGVRSFTFVARDVGVGLHTIRVQARFVAFASTLSFNGVAFESVSAQIRSRTATIEEVKLDAH